MNREVRDCFECESDYFADTSKMGHLCPDCSHILYGFTNCDHSFKNGRCSKCHWNGKSSDYVGKLKKESAMWTPISLSELQKEIDTGLLKMDSKQLEIWNEITVQPEKWQENEFGEDGGGFWIVAIDGNQVIWYNDIEEGFNISEFVSKGKIEKYKTEQDELQWTVNKLNRNQ